jgi:predicted RNA-binding protein YlxR (DUF448 family)
MSKRGHVPIRTCLGCRKKKRKEELVWFVQNSDRAVRINEKKPHQGRGFYLCPDLGCLNMAKKKNKGIGFMGTMDFQDALRKGWDRGGRG